jgi:hypothetical protein
MVIGDVCHQAEQNQQLSFCPNVFQNFLGFTGFWINVLLAIPDLTVRRSRAMYARYTAAHGHFQ